MRLARAKRHVGPHLPCRRPHSSPTARMMLLISILLASGVGAARNKCKQCEKRRDKCVAKRCSPPPPPPPSPSLPLPSPSPPPPSPPSLSPSPSLTPPACTGHTFTSKANLNTAVTEYVSNATAATAKYGPIAGWCVSGVTDMSALFDNKRNFNADISGWDTSRVTNMALMFSVRCSPPPPPKSVVAPSRLHAARAPQSLAAFRLLWPAARPAHRVPCLRPSAVRDGLQPAAQLGHVPRHEHGRHVLRALLPAPASQICSRALSPVHAARAPQSLAAFRLLWPAARPAHRVPCL